MRLWPQDYLFFDLLVAVLLSWVLVSGIIAIVWQLWP
jgi:Tfp pilus assembly protein PilW